MTTYIQLSMLETGANCKGDLIKKLHDEGSLTLALPSSIDTMSSALYLDTFFIPKRKFFATP